MSRALMSTIAFSWLAFIGVGHFMADVVSQLLRHKRAPSLETTLYYGLNSAYALGQALLAVSALWIMTSATRHQTSTLVLALLAGIAWFAIAYLSMEYWEPRAACGVFIALVVVALIAR